MSQTCYQCNQFYNLTIRRPILLTGCGCALCRECVTRKLRNNPTRQIKCPADLKISTMDEVFQDHMQVLIKLQQLDSLNAICDNHVKQKATLYCTKCQVLACFHCKQDTHKGHLLLEIKKSGFTNYMDHVNTLLDKYSAKNIKAQLFQQSQNRSQLQAFQLKELLTNVKTILGNFVTDEEQKQIDIAYYSEEYQRNPQQIQGLLNKSEEQKSQRNLNIEEVQTLINQSQQQLREEFNIGLGSFENNQTQINNKINQQVDLRIKLSQYSQQKNLIELKKEIQSNLQERFSAVDQIKIQLNQQDQFRMQSDHQLQNLNAIVETIKKQLDQKIKGQSAKQLERKDLLDFRASIESANLKIEQELQGCKFVQNVFELKIQSLQQESNSIKVCNSKQKNQSLNDFDQLEEKLKNMIKQELKNNTQMNKEVKQIFEQENLKNKSIESQNRSQILQQEEQKQSQAMANQLVAIVQVPSVKDCMKLSDQLKMKLFRDLVDQEINKTQHSILQRQISNYSSLQYKLLYCGSRDGFKANKFHSLCDNQGPTVSFILSECGLVFGGYTSIPWTSNCQWKRDPTAFVFSLSKRSIHKQYRNQQRAVQHYKDWMCVFGNDIVIDDNCDQKSNSYCNLGSTYELPNGYVFKLNEAQLYLAGQFQFKVLEIQVYSLK